MDSVSWHKVVTDDEHPAKTRVRVCTIDKISARISTAARTHPQAYLLVREVPGSGAQIVLQLLGFLHADHDRGNHVLLQQPAKCHLRHGRIWDRHTAEFVTKSQFIIAERSLQVNCSIVIHTISTRSGSARTHENGFSIALMLHKGNLRTAPKPKKKDI